MHTDYWQDKVCVVTGASVGLGAVIARTLSARGARLILVARSEQRLQQLAENLRALGGDVHAIAADVTVAEDVQQLAEQTNQLVDRVDMLCNCAGRSARGAILDTSADDFQELLDVNFLAAVRTTRIFAPQLIEQRGHVVQIGSLASKVAARYLGAYPASKFALAAYTQQLRLELEPQGLHVLLVCPGPILRDEADNRYAKQAVGLPDAANKPGGGAKLKGIDPEWLAEQILAVCERRQPELIVPWKVRVLAALSQLSPRFGDWLLRRATS